jgi:hypothetical protein
MAVPYGELDPQRVVVGHLDRRGDPLYDALTSTGLKPPDA